ncbi:hypothetical protein ACFE04_004013 [Oxalis oulophora]
MKILEGLFFVFLVGFALIDLVHAQDQSGFISIDCCATFDYTDYTTGINYTTDESFIYTGILKNVSDEYQTDLNQRLILTLRIFPDGTRNCYNVNKLTKGSKYLIRATFFYGNYDTKNQGPKFDIHLGANIWGHGTPLISGLEFRILNNNNYVIHQPGSLDFFAHWDVGSKATENIRFPHDSYDRIWTPFHKNNWLNISTNGSNSIDTSNNSQLPPGIVMQTAATMKNANEELILPFEGRGIDFPKELYVFMYFEELVELVRTDNRSFNILLDGEPVYGPVAPELLSVNIVNPTMPFSNTFSLFKTETSTLPPILNAIEVYSVKNLSQVETDQKDVDAVSNINTNYKLSKDWQGDPCSPKDFMWVGLKCSDSVYDPPRIVSLNLSSSKLSGELDHSFSSLTMLLVL